MSTRAHTHTRTHARTHAHTHTHTRTHARTHTHTHTVNANHPVVRQLIVDSLVHWVTEYHVDGFRFDLASCLCRGARRARAFCVRGRVLLERAVCVCVCVCARARVRDVCTCVRA
jgi:hypothetical protein